ncbi:MAG: response regulator [Deltaproteobacteria bacterium]|nr:response regulator [Deltaproteobacteria bacterium]
MATILIAEDVPAVVPLVAERLTRLGHRVLLARDGEEAEATIRAERPDLVILDVVLPKRNGFQLCRSLRATPEFARLPIIVVTAMDRESDQYWGLKQGADEYLVQPVDPEALLESVAGYLPGS